MPSRPISVSAWERRYNFHRDVEVIAPDRTTRQMSQLPHDIHR